MGAYTVKSLLTDKVKREMEKERERERENKREREKEKEREREKDRERQRATLPDRQIENMSEAMQSCGF